MDIVQSPVGVPRGPRENGYGELAQGLGKGAELVGGLQAAQRKQDLQSFDADTTTAMRKAHKELMTKAESISDAAEYQTTINKGSEDIYKEFGKTAKGDPEKQRILQTRYGQTLEAITDNVGAGVVSRRKATTVANLAKFKENLIDAAIDSDNPQLVRDLMGDFHNATIGAPYLKDDERQRVWEDLKRDLPYQWLAHQAVKDPVDFIKRYDRKEFDGLADTTSLDKAVDLATRTADLRARKDEKEGKAQSDDALRRFEREAESKKLNVGEFMDHAKRYGWDKNTTDGILKMQLGLKVANPNEKLLIEHAMLPANANVKYNLADVLRAEKNLKDLAKQGLASTDSEDYNSAMVRLQGMRDKLDVRADVKDRTSTFDARQAIQNLYGKFLPGNNSRNVIAEKNAHFDKIETMDAAAREKYVDNLRKDFEKKQAENQGPQIHRENLRNIPAR